MAPRSPLLQFGHWKIQKCLRKRVPKIIEVLRKYDPQGKVKTTTTKFGSLRQEKIEQQLYNLKGNRGC